MNPTQFRYRKTPQVLQDQVLVTHSAESGERGNDYGECRCPFCDSIVAPVLDRKNPFVTFSPRWQCPHARQVIDAGARRWAVHFEMEV